MLWHQVTQQALVMGCWLLTGVWVQSPYGQWDAQWCGPFGNNLGVPQEVTLKPPCDPALPFPGLHLREVTADAHLDTHMNVLSSKSPCGQTPTSRGGLCLRGAPFA